MVSTIRPVAIYALDLMHVMDVPFTHACEGDARRKSYDSALLGGDSNQPRDASDEGFDVIYIDADHDYAGVCRDLEAAKHKVRVGACWYSTITSNGVYPTHGRAASALTENW